MRDWEAVVAAALTLPGVERGTTYGKPAVKMNGKMNAATTGPSPDSFVLAVTKPEKEVLLETDPDTFWETDHYKGWPAVLVRYGTDAGERIETYLQRRWWDLAKKAQREAFGDRP
jgi:hypothetical protein